MKDLLWSNWNNGIELNFEITKNFYYKHIDQNESIYNNRYFVKLVKHSNKKLELIYPFGILKSFKYFEFLGEFGLGEINPIISSIFIEITDNDEIQRVMNLSELNSQFKLLFDKILEEIEEKHIDIVKTKFSYLLQEKGRIQNILWPEIDFLLEDYLIQFEDDIYVDFDDNSENDEIVPSHIDMCQEYKNDNNDYVVEYFEAYNNFLEKKNNFIKMKLLFLDDGLDFKQLKSIKFKHRKYLYDKTNCALKSAICYRKLDSAETKKLDKIEIKCL